MSESSSGVLKSNQCFLRHQYSTLQTSLIKNPTRYIRYAHSSGWHLWFGTPDCSGDPRIDKSSSHHSFKESKCFHSAHNLVQRLMLLEPAGPHITGISVPGCQLQEFVLAPVRASGRGHGHFYSDWKVSAPAHRSSRTVPCQTIRTCRVRGSSGTASTEQHTRSWKERGPHPTSKLCCIHTVNGFCMWDLLRTVRCWWTASSRAGRENCERRGRLHRRPAQHDCCSAHLRWSKQPVFIMYDLHIRRCQVRCQVFGNGHLAKRDVHLRRETNSPCSHNSHRDVQRCVDSSFWSIIS